MSEQVIIFDTTLRDGEQSPGASLNVDEKVEIAKQLARLGVDVVEAGFPISSQADFEAVKVIAETVEGPTIAALARTVPIDIDRAYEALRNGKKTRIHTFIATSDIHLQFKLKKSRAEVLEMAVRAVKLAKSYVDDVEFSPEDAVRSDLDYMCEVITAAIDAGATTINIPDTVGYSLPWEFGALIKAIRERVPNIGKAALSVHCHNDLGMAVANSVAGVLNGARQVECTINGIGERAGNASLEEIVMAVKTRRDLLGVHTNINTKEIWRTSRLVSDLTGFVVQPNKAIVGKNAFAHEAGIHQHGVLSANITYEIMDPRDIGLERSELPLGRHSGHHAFEAKLKEMGYDLTPEQVQKAYLRFKDLAAKKKEISDWDIESLVADEIHAVPEVFHLEYMHVVSGGSTVPTATIVIRKNTEVIQKAEMGVGTVDAVYKTIDAICKVPHRLVDYSVKSVTGGTDALGEVTVRIRDSGGSVYIGRGAAEDIIEASARAYLQAINKLVSRVPYGNGRPTAQQMEVAKEIAERV